MRRDPDLIEGGEESLEELPPSEPTINEGEVMKSVLMFNCECGVTLKSESLFELHRTFCKTVNPPKPDGCTCQHWIAAGCPVHGIGADYEPGPPKQKVEGVSKVTKISPFKVLVDFSDTTDCDAGLI